MKLTSKHKVVALALVEGKQPKSKIAKENNVSRQTLYNWMLDKDFLTYMKHLAEIEENEAKRIATYNSREAVRRQLWLISQDPDKVDAETVRKACRDLLETGGLISKKEMPDVSRDPVEIQIIEEIVGEPDEKLAERADRISKRAAKIRDRFSEN